jgi:murein DD-endopeptidase MepM/ murein hydrolase activator NlpD
MRTYLAKRRSRRVLQWGVVSAVALCAAGCSQDTTRFGENPNASPYASRPPSNQYSAAPAQPAQVSAAQAPAVERQPLPQVQYAQPSQYAPAQSAQPQYAPPAPPIRTAPEVTGTVHTGHWDSDGGTAVVVASGETIEIISRRWGVPSQAVMQANNITKPGALAPGQKLVIPRYVVGGTGAQLAHAAAPRTPAAPAPVATAAPRAAPAPLVAAAPRAPAAAVQSTAGLPASAPTGSAQTLLPPPPVHTVASGDNLGKIANKYHVKVKDLALANGITPETRLNVGTQLTVPVKVVAAPPKAKPGAPAVVQAKPLVVAPGKPGAHGAAAPGKVAAADVSARVASPVEAPAEEANLTAPNGAPAFRWPARGRVINNFGAKVNGANNDGIDLAVPEGTQVRAADDGVVAYAGNELKGYGNLVLVRHSNGFVTAYANASELLVKRNDQVHKGQVILKSGQTGTAPAPQLHFEVRKNSSPVDPIQFLPSDKTASAPL